MEKIIIEMKIFSYWYYNPFVDDYGYLKVKNVSMTTIGDTEQNELIHGKLVHHLIITKTKERKQLPILTIINNDQL